MSTNNKIKTGALVCLDKNSKVPGALTAIKLRAGFEAKYKDMIGIVVEDHDRHVFVLFANGDRKYIHKTFLKALEEE